MINELLVNLVNTVLGTSKRTARGNQAYHCPFCNHHKPKLEINFATNEKGENPWECWVCNTRGRTIRSLLYQLKTPKDQAREILKYVKKGDIYEYKHIGAVELPKNFQYLYNATKSSIIANKIRKYLYERGLTDNDFIKYDIGYCTSGEYGGRIIIPSYSSSNQLIFFENLINWNQPIILCEGVFDAIAIRRNAIPILGKSISKQLLKKIIQSNVNSIYIALDQDAIKKALEYCEQFLSIGKKVYFIDLKEKDPSDMGFLAFTQHVQQAQELDLTSLMRFKLTAV